MRGDDGRADPRLHKGLMRMSTGAGFAAPAYSSSAKSVATQTKAGQKMFLKVSVDDTLGICVYGRSTQQHIYIVQQLRCDMAAGKRRSLLA